MGQRNEAGRDDAGHWEGVYRTKRFDGVSWYAPHLEESLRLIRALAPDPHAPIIDVGGGESTLVDDLLAEGRTDLSVLDISATAIEFTRARLGVAADSVRWFVDDVRTADFGGRRFALWHDRAVFHFLREPQDRAAYVARVRESVIPGGHVVMATFGPDGPLKCSGLDIMRYDADALHGQFGQGFELLGNELEAHRTPFGTDQQFLYCWCRLG